GDFGIKHRSTRSMTIGAAARSQRLLRAAHIMRECTGVKVGLLGGLSVFFKRDEFSVSAFVGFSAGDKDRFAGVLRGRGWRGGCAGCSGFGRGLVAGFGR